MVTNRIMCRGMALTVAYCVVRAYQGIYYIILDSPRGSVLKYRRLVFSELGIHAFFILFFQVRSFLQKNEYTKVYWWIVLSYFVSPRKMGRSTHRFILAFF